MIEITAWHMTTFNGAALLDADIPVLDHTLPEADGVLIGAKALQDALQYPSQFADRLLNIIQKKNWRMYVVDSHGLLEGDAHVLKARFPSSVILLANDSPHGWVKKVKEIGFEYIIRGDGQVDLCAGLNEISRIYDVNKLLTVGGGCLTGALLQQSLLCRLILLRCGRILSDGNTLWKSWGELSRKLLPTSAHIETEIFVETWEIT